jgi:hypothetical protein
MKLNDLFPHIAHHTQSVKDRNYKYDLLRSLLDNRKDYGIDNNVIELRRNYEKVRVELSKLFPARHVESTLDEFLSYPGVRGALGDDVFNDQYSESEDENQTYSTTDEEGTEEGDEADKADKADEEEKEEPGNKYIEECSYYMLCRDTFLASLLVGNMALSILIASKLYS